MPRTDFTWIVPADYAACRGHFPDRPIVPGAALLDRAVLCAETLCRPTASAWQVAQAKFLLPVAPGTVLLYELQARADGSLVFTIRADDLPVATGRLQPVP